MARRNTLASAATKTSGSVLGPALAPSNRELQSEPATNDVPHPAATRSPSVTPLRPAAESRIRKKKHPFNISIDVLEEARDAAWHIPGLSLSGICERGLERELTQLRALYTEGKRFPKREGQLLPGRPLSGPLRRRTD